MGPASFDRLACRLNRPNFFNSSSPIYGRAQINMRANLTLLCHGLLITREICAPYIHVEIDSLEVVNLIMKGFLVSNQCTNLLTKMELKNSIKLYIWEEPPLKIHLALLANFTSMRFVRS